MNNEQKDFQEKINKVEEALKKALQENGLEMKTVIDFPKYRELPISVQLAMELLKNEGASVIRKYSPLELKDKKI